MTLWLRSMHLTPLSWHSCSRVLARYSRFHTWTRAVTPYFRKGEGRRLCYTMTDLDAAVVEAAVDPLLVRLDAQHEAVAEQPLGLK